MVAAVLNGPAKRAARLRQREIAHFQGIDRSARALSGMSDAEVTLISCWTPPSPELD
jgi:hypothetical protein